VKAKPGFGVRLCRLFRASGGIAVLALAAGCFFGGGGAGTKGYSVVVAPNANGYSPIPVEMVAVFDRKMVDEVAGLTAADWFQRRDQFGRDYPDRWASKRWEFVPGQSMPLHGLERELRGARALFLWADYPGEGPHRVRLDTFGWVTIEFGEKDVAVKKVR
jgi:type VI secretion system protein